ncbi:MAG: diphthine synthase [Candidatus Aenigmatarchaeota archaeon]
MLYLIGLGLGDEKSLSLEAIEAAKKCKCYCELYTNKWFGNIAGLERLVETGVKELKRKDLEEGTEEIVREARQKDIAIFVPGDPLAATTHVELVLEAKKQGTEVKIIHNSSIFSAVAESGLQLYKFGRTATVPFSGQMEAVKEALEANRAAGLHTLLLLDLDVEGKKYMTVPEALKMLGNLVQGKVIAASRLGYQPKIAYGAKEDMRDIGTPAVLVVPGKLHFKEEEFLKSL